MQEDHYPNLTHTQLHKLDFHLDAQVWTSSSPDSQAGRGSWQLLLCEYSGSLQPFLHRPALFPVCRGRLFVPSECTPPLHCWGQEVQVGLGGQGLPSLPTPHPCHPCRPCHLCPPSHPVPLGLGLHPLHHDRHDQLHHPDPSVSPGGERSPHHFQFRLAQHFSQYEM